MEPTGVHDEDELESQRRIARLQLEENLYYFEDRYRRGLSAGLTALLMILVAEFVLVELVLLNIVVSVPFSPLLSLWLGYGWNLQVGPFWNAIFQSAFRIIPFWFVTLAIACPLYYFGLRVPLNRARKELRDSEARVQRERLSSREGRLDYLREKVRNLSHETARVFLDNEERYNQAKEWRDQVEDILEQDGYPNLGEAESLVTSIYELKDREESEVRQQRTWRYLAIAIIVVYIAVLIVVSFVYGGSISTVIPVFAVPLSVAMWAAAGSLAAILYRFYTEEERVRLDLEVRWLIARPVIGIIMGMVTYLAINAGLLLLNATPLSDTDGAAQADRLAVYWVIAFIAGFSDKFYIRIINLLVERTVGNEDQVPSEAEQTKTAKPPAKQSKLELPSPKLPQQKRNLETPKSSPTNTATQMAARVRMPDIVPWLIGIVLSLLVGFLYWADRRYRGCSKPRE